MKIGALIICGLSIGCATPAPVQSSRQGLIQKWSTEDRSEQRKAARDSSRSKELDPEETNDLSFDRRWPRPKKRSKSQISSLTSKSGDSKSTSERSSGDLLKWTWPLESVDVSSSFGWRGKHFHEGLDLRAKMGTPIVAARDGEAFYVGSKIKGYGNMVVLKHDDGFFTVYAHASRLIVKEGQKVSAGDLIALAGKSGRARGVHLHFELRKGVAAVDPLNYLPGTKKTASHRSERDSQVD